MRTWKVMGLSVMCICLALILFLSPASSKDQPAESPQWGAAVNGLQMSISVADPGRADAAEFQVVLRNVGEQDFTLNLGTMLANGKTQIPQSISLTLADAGGGKRQFKFSDARSGFVAGRVDDYVVPLRAGSSYTLKLSAKQFWSPDAKDYGLKLPSGKYQLTAWFVGGGATTANSDTAGVKLMNFWQGTLQSNTLAVEK